MSSATARFPSYLSNAMPMQPIFEKVGRAILLAARIFLSARSHYSTIANIKTSIIITNIAKR